MNLSWFKEYEQESYKNVDHFERNRERDREKEQTNKTNKTKSRNTRDMSTCKCKYKREMPLIEMQRSKESG